MNIIEWKCLQTFGQVERNNNRSSQIESTQGGQLTDGTKTPRQSINQLCCTHFKTDILVPFI